MSLYLIVNRAPSAFEPGPEAFAAWTSWFESLGPALKDRGNPVFRREALGSCGADTQLGGYTLLSAGSFEAALELARNHPLLSRGGGVEVGELTIINTALGLASENAGDGR